MRWTLVLCALLGSLALSGCGGGGGPAITRNARFQIGWPARSRDALNLPLTSAQSARVVVVHANEQGGNVTMNVDRDPLRLSAYTATYGLSQPIVNGSLSTLRATFFAQAGQGGSIVGTATTTVQLVGNFLQFSAISLSGTVANVSTTGANLTVGSGATQLTFAATDADGGAVAVSSGSAVWSLVDGGGVISLSADGNVTPITQGTAHVRVTVDGQVSPVASVVVSGPPEPAFTWSAGKGGTLIQPSFNAVEGTQFQVQGGKDVVVTSLGYEFKSATQVPGDSGIFDADGNLLAKATVSTADPLVDGYYYKEITPIVLTAGGKYFLGALHGTGAAGAYFHKTNAPETATFIKFLRSTFKGSSTIEGGSWDPSSSPLHFTANFQAHQAP